MYQRLRNTFLDVDRGRVGRRLQDITVTTPPHGKDFWSKWKRTRQDPAASSLTGLVWFVFPQNDTAEWARRSQALVENGTADHDTGSVAVLAHMPAGPRRRCNYTESSVSL